VARVCGQRDVADDILQESFFRFMVSGHTHLAHEAARPYLFRVATNLLNDRWRRQDESYSSSTDAPATDISNDSALDANRLLKAMKPRERQLLWLAYAEGMNHREIATVTGLNVLSVRVLLLRARRHAAYLLLPKTDNDEN
jgi:RNA polymerase sigma-70 factor, ECF subfamily